jgi:hypothetical protein
VTNLEVIWICRLLPNADGNRKQVSTSFVQRGTKSSFFLHDNEELLVCKPIYEYEEILKEYGFIRCHQL